VLYEEPRLTKVFGEEYLEYKKSVPRWVGFRRAGGANGRAELS
jgi:protein-S-isoprenylcysteine O-methyltransferase Ste14